VSLKGPPSTPPRTKAASDLHKLKGKALWLKTWMCSKLISAGTWQEGQAVKQSQLHISLGKCFLYQQTFCTSDLFYFCIPSQKVHIKQEQRLKTHAIYIKEANKG